MNRLLTVALMLLSERASAGLPTPQGTPIVHSQQRGYVVAAYELQASPADALAHYARALKSANYRVHTIQGALAVRGRDTAVVHAFRDGERTVLALVRLGDEEQARDQ